MRWCLVRAALRAARIGIAVFEAVRIRRVACPLFQPVGGITDGSAAQVTAAAFHSRPARLRSAARAGGAISPARHLDKDFAYCSYAALDN